MELIKAGTHTCTVSFASFEIFAFAGNAFFIIQLTLAIGKNLFCSVALLPRNLHRRCERSCERELLKRREDARVGERGERRREEVNTTPILGVCSFVQHGSSDTIYVHQNISDGETIVSGNEKFELGFFSPGNSKDRYLGIWFKNTSPQTVVWVANREIPLKDNLGMVKLDDEGNLFLVNGNSKVIWSSNSSTSGTNINRVAQLLDTGNLVIKNGNETLIWQSFDYPGDTYLPGVKMGKNFITGRETYPTSWRSADDPSQGEYTLKFLMAKGKYPQAFIMRSSVIETRIGPWNGITYSSQAHRAPDANLEVVSTLIVNQNESYVTYTPKSNIASFRSQLTLDGKVELSYLKFPNPEWTPIFTTPVDYCDRYGVCGPYGSCTTFTSPNCGCLKGFELKNLDETSTNNGLNSSFHSKKRTVRAVTLSTAAVLTLLGLILTFHAKRKWKKRSDAEREVYKGSSTNQMRSAEVPLFSLSKICRATNDFSNDNKLGGGFGPVYKGVLEEGQEIAVKRLSKSSRQGLDEFKNEVICIAKLQHRNLVKLLGYCIQGDEKMLIYEYLSNKSLDYFLFADESRKSLLDWPQRFQIIQGIARGVLYLHQDSRQKVVHRDLKAGNILLDHQMFPKIADFGLARMFKENESEANTKRVVGTLGYISPEYAVNGLFSLKSDIFSFGVLVLEIVSGKKNRGFVHEDHEDNLLGHAWRLFKKGKSLDLIDECLHVSYSACEVSRSIHVGLLCVQQRVEDRPNTPTVVGMLGGEGSLPFPKKPAFYIQESEINSTSNLSLLPSSVNELTFSQLYVDPSTVVYKKCNQVVKKTGNAKFKLGFISPGNSKDWYLGIWFANSLSPAFAWVANRETPLTNTLGAVKLDNQGILTLVDGSGKVIWSSNSSIGIRCKYQSCSTTVGYMQSGNQEWK
ncbi:hypothetical protein E3N88_38417 [Mikania micrantha]|uniref:non-specific serine/threonine protein kinase n=1 Tax=Mikania micrantha TaxID=192012 RepID=A0A5N6LU74_9ASTR|nr:hypothetical protein E3N88_38417 [Mikania micrantha]